MDGGESRGHSRIAVRPRCGSKAILAILVSPAVNGDRRYSTAGRRIAGGAASCRLQPRPAKRMLGVAAPNRSQREGGEQMQTKLMWMALIAGVVMFAGMYAENVRATEPFGFIGTTIAQGRFEDIDAATQVLREFGDLTPKKDLWLSLQKTKGPSDLYVQSNEFAVGGSSGWHTHPSHSLIIVTAGTVTAYDGDDPSCTPKTYSAKSVNGSVNMGFVDPGGDHFHLLRNEGPVVARTIVVQLIPASASRRIDVTPGPASCLF